jgi:zinc finger protein
MEFPTIGSVLEKTMDEGSSPSDASGGGGGSTRNFEPDADGVMAIPSLCMGCGETGLTRLLLTHIPFFRDVILMAFECEACGLRNSEVQSAGIADRGAKFEVTVTTPSDLNRQLVKGDRASARVEELDLEIPCGTQSGVFTTIEGLLAGAGDALRNSQPLRRALSADDADSVDAFLARLDAARAGLNLPFTFILDDPSGNSFVENPVAPKADPRMKVRFYVRTVAQNESLCIYENDAAAGATDAVVEGEEGEDVIDSSGSGLAGSGATAQYTNRAVDLAGVLEAAAAKVRRSAPAKDMSGNVPSGFKKGGAQIKRPTDRAAASGDAPRMRAGITRDASGGISSFMFDSSASSNAAEAIRFAVDCHNCGLAGDCLMCVTDVPHFKEVILMGFSCDGCGWKNVEVKGGGAVPPMGTITELCFVPNMVYSMQDLGRDVIKGDTASVEIPELDLELAQGSLGGLYSTVEGMLALVRDKLEEIDPLGAGGGDSLDVARRGRYASLLSQLDECREGKRAFTLRLVDPMANTWIHSPFAGTSVIDPRLKHESYVRTHEEDLDLGLLDMDAPRQEEEIFCDASSTMADGETEGGCTTTSAAPGGAGRAWDV